jgi:hypothetical protein
MKIISEFGCTLGRIKETSLPELTLIPAYKDPAYAVAQQ